MNGSTLTLSVTSLKARTVLYIFSRESNEIMYALTKFSVKKLMKVEYTLSINKLNTNLYYSYGS